MPLSCCSVSRRSPLCLHLYKSRAVGNFSRRRRQIVRGTANLCDSPQLFRFTIPTRGITMKKTLLSASLAALLAGLASNSAMALEQRPVLSLDVAKKMAAACEAKAKQENWKMNIAIVDSGGNLKFF